MFSNTYVGSATTGMDFAVFEDFPVVFPAGSVLGDMQCFNITIDDNVFEQEEEVFSVITVPEPNFFIISVNNSVNATIIDNEG